MNPFLERVDLFPYSRSEGHVKRTAGKARDKGQTNCRCLFGRGEMLFGVATATSAASFSLMHQLGSEAPRRFRGKRE